MATWLIVIIVIGVINLLLAIWAFVIANNSGNDPMSAFLAVIITSIIGFILVTLMRDGTSPAYKRTNESDYESDSKPVEHLPIDINTVVIFYSPKTKFFHMIANNAPIGSEQHEAVFATPGIKYFLQKGASMEEISKEDAIKLFK